MNHQEQLARELSLPLSGVEATAALLAEGATVPFIARYRKEATGALDEVAITAIRDGLKRLADLDERREAILKSLTERELLTPELETSIKAASTMTTLEDLYLPFRPKRRTRAMAAKEAGLEPLAQALLEGSVDPMATAENYLSDTIATVEDALAGARDIIAEEMSEDRATRSEMRLLFVRFGIIESHATKEAPDSAEGKVYEFYFDRSERLATVPSHRLLAMMRGEREKWLTLAVRPSDDLALASLRRRWVKEGPCAEQVDLAITDGYKRLLRPAIENETRKALKERADKEAISIFARNLRELLMASPLGATSLLAIDPGVRTGCKIVALAASGALLAHDVAFLHKGANARAAEIITRLVKTYDLKAVAVGNGTGSREAMDFVRGLDLGLETYMVNEAGASVYSASDLAREEFPDQDVTVRGAVSIGRRLMDPLAELVKIDPKSIGVGQYQHDVDQKQLAQSLDDTVMSCVNAVGVNLNTASPRLLSYVSGLNATLAKSIVAYREEKGEFSSREELKKVPRVGPKTYQQAAGFLRLPKSSNPLDNTAVHPERYDLVTAMAASAGLTVEQLIADSTARQNLDLNQFVAGEVGLPTLHDVMSELDKPGRDVRGTIETFRFDERIHEIGDLEVGMQLPGIVTNVTAFGAFVDVGAHRDGLLHLTAMKRAGLKEGSLRPGMQVTVQVSEVDLERNRIALTWPKKSK